MWIMSQIDTHMQNLFTIFFSPYARICASKMFTRLFPGLTLKPRNSRKTAITGPALAGSGYFFGREPLYNGGAPM